MDEHIERLQGIVVYETEFKKWNNTKTFVFIIFMLL